MEGGASQQPPPVYWVAVVDVVDSERSSSDNEEMPAQPPSHLRNYYRWCQRPQKKVDIVVSSADSTSDFGGSTSAIQQNQAQAQAVAHHSSATATVSVPRREDDDDGPAGNLQKKTLNKITEIKRFYFNDRFYVYGKDC